LALGPRQIHIYKTKRQKKAAAKPMDAAKRQQKEGMQQSGSETNERSKAATKPREATKR